VQNLFSSILLSKNVKIKVYRTIKFLVVLYGCETWSVTLREEHRLTAFKNRVLRKIIGLNGVMQQKSEGDFTVRSFFICPPYQILFGQSRRMRWTGHGAHMGKKGGACRVLVGKPEGKRTLGMCRLRWEDNIKIGPQGVGRETCTAFIWLRIGRGDRLL